MATRAKHVYRFGPYRLDATDRLLYRGGELIALPPKVLDTLLLLVANSGHVLGKDEMMKRLWPETFVEEGTLAQYIFLLRKALGDSATWIENHPRRGYRFTAPVEEYRDCIAELQIEEPTRTSAAIREEDIASWGHLTRLRVKAVGIAVVAVVAAAVLSAILLKRAAHGHIDSVAVLPFRTVSDSGNDYLADGITDALITKLASLRGLRVVSYSRVRRFKGSSREAAEIGSQLGVQAVIEGTVRVNSGRTRLSVHAVDTKTSDTLWADDHFEAATTSVLDLERHVVEAVALRLRGHLTARERSLIAKRNVSSAEAYELLLRARKLLGKGRVTGSEEPAIRMLERAVALDPEFAETFGWLAFAQQAAYRRGLGGATALRAAISTANQALSRDPNALIALRALAHIQHVTGREVEGLLITRRALESAPDDLDAVAAAAEAYFRTGLYDQAIPLYERALAAEPDNREFRSQLVRIHLFRGDYEKGLDVISALPPSQAGTFGMLLYAETGQMDRALESLSDADTLNGFSAYMRGCVQAAAGDVRGARETWTDSASRGEDLIARSDNPFTRYGLSLNYAALGKKEQALHHMHQSLAPDPRHPVLAFFAAEVLALVGDRREALGSLRAAVENGFFNLPMVDYMGRSVAGTFRSLRHEPEFHAIRAELAHRIEELRARY